MGPITVGTGFASLYMPSARPLGPANDLGESTRQRRDTFSVGYKERVQVDIHGGGVWKWRRVVFTLKGDSLYDKVNSSVIGPSLSTARQSSRRTLHSGWIWSA